MRSVSELVEEGARVIADGLHDYMPMADLGRAIGRIQLQIHLQMRNRQGLPDIRATSDAAKEANRAMLAHAQDIADVGDDVMVKVRRAIHNHKADARSEYLASLDKPGADLSAYESILRPGVPASLSVAAVYGVSTAGRRDKDREQSRAVRKLRIDAGTPGERASSVVRAVNTLLGKADARDFSHLDGDELEYARNGLGDAAETIAALTEAVSR